MTTNGHQTHIYVGLAGEGDFIGQGGMLRRTLGRLRVAEHRQRAA